MATTRNAASRSTEPERVEVQEAPTDADAERIATLASILKGSEVQVGAPEEVIPQQMQAQQRMVVVRVNENVEDMSYVGAGRRLNFTFEAGHQYRVPVEIAMELERIRKVWH